MSGTEYTDVQAWLLRFLDAQKISAPRTRKALVKSGATEVTELTDGECLDVAAAATGKPFPEVCLNFLKLITAAKEGPV